MMIKTVYQQVYLTWFNFPQLLFI